MRKFDPELLYVECKECGQPIVWKYGMTTTLLEMAEIDIATLDERCLIMSEGCPACHPGETSFTTQIVRLNPEKDDSEATFLFAN